MVVDDEMAFVKSLNWATKNLTETRDYAVVTDHPHEVGEIVACFDADWHRKKFDPGDERPPDLVPDQRPRPHRRSSSTRRSTRSSSRTSATRTPSSSSASCAPRERGVKVHVMARPPHSLKKEKLVEGVGGLRILDDVGIKIHKLKGLKLHGKMLLADGVAAIVGSINLAPGSFDNRRELAIEVRDDDVVERLHKIAQHDWKNSHPLDLSDEGLLADLEDREEGAAGKLAIETDKK